MIIRSWRGTTRRADTGAYVAYLGRTGVAELRATPGNRGVLVLTHPGPETTEFTVMSFWNALDDIRGFAGEDVDAAVFYPEDDRFLITRELRVRHDDIAIADGIGE
jgi:hypothetical protein